MPQEKYKEVAASSSIPLTRRDIEFLFEHRARNIGDLAAERAIKEREARRKNPAYDEEKEKKRLEQTVKKPKEGYNSTASTLVGRFADNVYHNSGAADAKDRLVKRAKRVVTLKQDPLTAVGGTVADVIGVVANSAAKGADSSLPGNPTQHLLEKFGQTIDLGRWINAVKSNKSVWDPTNNGFYDLLSENGADYAQDAWATALLAVPGVKRISKSSKTVKPQPIKGNEVIVPLQDGSYLSIPQEVAAKLLKQQSTGQPLLTSKTTLPSIEELLKPEQLFTVKEPTSSSTVKSSGRALPAPKLPALLPEPESSIATPTKRIPTIFINKERVEAPIWRWYEKGENGKLQRGEIMTNGEIGEANRTGTLQVVDVNGNIVGPFQGMGKGNIWIEGRKVVKDEDGNVRVRRPDETGGWYGGRVKEGEKRDMIAKGYTIKLGNKNVYLKGYNPYGEQKLFPLREYLKHVGKHTLDYEFADPEILRPLLNAQFGGDVGELTFIPGKYGDALVKFTHPKTGQLWSVPIQPKYIEGYHPTFNPVSGLLGSGHMQGAPVYLDLISEFSKKYDTVREAQEAAKAFGNSLVRPTDYFDRLKAVARATMGQDYNAILNLPGAQGYIDAISRILDADARILRGELPRVGYRALNPLAQNGVVQPSWIQQAALSTQLGIQRAGLGELQGGIRTLPVVTRKGSYHSIADLSEANATYGGLFASEFDTLDDPFYMQNVGYRLRKKFGADSPQVKIYDGILELAQLKHRYLQLHFAFDPELDALLRKLTEAYNASIGYDPLYMYKQHLIVPHTGKILRLDAKGQRWLHLDPNTTEIVTPDLLHDPLAKQIVLKTGNDLMAALLKRAASDAQVGTDINAIRIGNVHDGSYVLGQGLVTDIPAHAPAVKSTVKGRTPVWTSPEIPVGTELLSPTLIENSNIILKRPGLHYDSNGRIMVTPAIVSGEGYLPMYHMFINPEAGEINYSGYRKKGGKIETIKLFKKGGLINTLNKPLNWEDYQIKNRKPIKKLI